VHASVYLRTCLGTLIRRPLAAEVSVKSYGQTTLVRVTAGTSGRGMVLTLSAPLRTDVGTVFFREADISSVSPEDAPIAVGRRCDYKTPELQRTLARVSGGVSTRHKLWWIGRGGKVILAKQEVDLR
jgi:hypothetical protein